MIVFGSDDRTAPGHVDSQASARGLIDGGPVAIGLAPATYRNQDDHALTTVGAVSEDGDPCSRQRRESPAGWRRPSLPAPPQTWT
jgi:hypothetical protein